MAETPEIIKEIRLDRRDYWNKWDGYTIVTNKQKIEIGCDNRSRCCEDWGFVTSDDNVGDFIDMHLLGISVVNEKLENIRVPHLYEGGAMFVNIETAIGVLQFVVYNIQNGYYGHTAFVRCNQLNHTEQI